MALCLLAFGSAAQQQTSASGLVRDPDANITLHNASILLLHAKDSILYKFTRADKDGRFAFEHVAPGDYVLLTSYPAYADYTRHFSVESTDTPVDFGTIELRLRATVIEEVLVRGVQAITIKGDTTEFDPRAFVIQPNDKVEDLLKQLPGITIDQNGQITAQGKRVERVLVEGEEFFGDDPTLVTRNIRSDMVDKVQLYEKMSDQATFTGVDDGERSQTINIKLKEDSKRGYFGKIDVGGGTNEMHEGQAMFNRFNNKQRFSVYGNLANTGKTGLSWQDNDRFGASAGNVQFTDDGGIMIMMGGGGQDEIEGWSGRYDGRGIPLAHNGGAHYSNKWDDDKHSINGSYKIGQLRVTGENNTRSQNNLPSGYIHSENEQDFDRLVFRQRANAIYDLRIDSSANLKLTIDGALRSGENSEVFGGTSRNAVGELLNTSLRNLNNNTEGQQFNASALWTKKLRKVGRTLSWNLSQSYNDSKADGLLYSENEFYNNLGVADSLLVVDQQKVNNTRSSATNSNITYTEPLTDYLTLVANYGLSLNNSTSLRQSFNASSPGNYTDLDSLYSNDFKLHQLSHQVGAIFNVKKDAHTINFGTRVSAVQFDQLDRFNDERFERNFMNWNPTARWQYRMGQSKSLTVGYNGNNSQPQVSQLQPVRVNDDPLNVVVGNPDLKPSFTNRFNASYNSYKVLKGESLFFWASYSNTLNPIVSNVMTDSVGASVFRFDNLTDRTNANFNVNANYGRKIEKLNTNVGIGLNGGGNVYHNITNNELNQTHSYNIGASLDINQHVQKKYNYYISGGPQYNVSKASLQPDFNNNGWGVGGNFSFNVYLPGKFEIGSQGRYTFTAATQSFDEDFERLIVDANISKRFLKDESLVLRATVNDIFNQNVGFSRYANNNMLSENHYTTIRRFFMLSLVWDFSKMGGTPNNN